jgi:hypothetical protein
MKKAADRGQHSEGVEQIGRGVAMGPKHFQLLSGVLAKNVGQPHSKIVGDLADALAGTNPRFNKGKFKAGCGVN